MNRKLLALALLIMVLSTAAAGVYLYNRNLASQQAKREQTVVSKEVVIESSQIDGSEIPGGFPANLPVESGAKVLQNYQTTTSDGRVQSTRVVTTNRTLAQVVTTYQNFFANLGWDETSSDESDKNNISVLMKKGDDTLMITATNMNQENKNTISLTLTQAVGSETNQDNE